MEWAETDLNPAEREMARVFAAKGRTGGLNTESQGGRNMHIRPSPLPLHPHGG